MQLIADILLGAGAIGAALYCIVLSRRLRHFADLENGVGGAIASLSAQVDGMTTALDQARKTARDAGGSLEAMTTRADEVAGRLELLVAALHDLPDPEPRPSDQPVRGADPRAEAGDSIPDILFSTGRADRPGATQ